MNGSPRKPGFLPTASIDVLRKRADLMKQVRQFFDDRGFLEVDTPVLSHDVVVDRHLEPIPVSLPNQPESRFWLQTSPEFLMKRLLAAGATAIYQITRAFRAGESGDKHNPEFTMVEWYRVGDDYVRGMDLLDEFSQQVLGCQSADRMTYRNAFEKAIGIDPLDCPLESLAQVARENEIELTDAFDNAERDDWLDLLLAELVEPELGTKRPAIIYDWPATQAALAKTRSVEGVAERFELFIDATEIANGYHELTDADELLSRNRRVNRQRMNDGKIRLPEDSELIEAMRCGLPGCCGVALGFDRSLMLLLGAERISDVMPFPIDRA